MTGPPPARRGTTTSAPTRLRAREVHGENRWWAVADAAWPHFAQFRADAGDREIPVSALDPVH
ncbi:hypothetical protein AB0L57_23940 [Nocardia sp. NPDC052254]|uniref:hypothetical protein n=1 Tax=Nocardia sp. NPDC052254 TaxID=3155681 RepID=UPI00342AFCE9